MEENKLEIIQVNIYGADKPGLTTALTDILARYDAFILDIGQANIHNSLTLGILFLTQQDRSGQSMKELLFKSSSLGVHIRFKPVSEEDYNSWRERQGKDRYIITLLSRSIDARKMTSPVFFVVKEKRPRVSVMPPSRVPTTKTLTPTTGPCPSMTVPLICVCAKAPERAASARMRVVSKCFMVQKCIRGNTPPNSPDRQRKSRTKSYLSGSNAIFQDE